MHKRTSQILQQLLEQHPHGENLLKTLPAEIQEKIPTVAFSPLKSLISPCKTTLHQIHYSWLLPFIHPLPPEEQAIYLGLLSKEQKKGLLHKLSDIPTSCDLKPWAQRFFFPKLLDNCLQDLPPPSEKASPFFPLLALSKKRYLKFMDYLGLHLLVKEMHVIVDRETLKKIYTSLTKNQTRYLQSLIKQGVQKEKSSKVFQLTKWDKKSLSLQLMLHKQGLKRFAQLLEEENLHIQWQMVHKLDVGRGKLIEKYLQNPSKHPLSSMDKMQAKHLIRLFSKQKQSKETP